MTSTMTAMAATRQTNQTRKPNAPASERSGLGGMRRTFTADGARAAGGGDACRTQAEA